MILHEDVLFPRSSGRAVGGDPVFEKVSPKGWKEDADSILYSKHFNKIRLVFEL